MDRDCRVCGRPIERGERGELCWEHTEQPSPPPPPQQPQADLFSETRLAPGTITGNKLLEEAANIVLDVTMKHPEVLQHDTVGKVDRAIYAEVLLSGGMRTVLAAPSDQALRFRELLVNTGGPRAPESLRRGRQYLVEHDHIRLSAAAIREAAKHQGRIQHAMGGKR